MHRRRFWFFIIHYSLIATIPTTNNHQPTTNNPTAGRKCEDDLFASFAPLREKELNSAW
ncbi:MAG TPA: hypothetical protein PKK99_06485 [Bacteroidia bacterium]|nr:hypothetical protein [Bacteroidia bacterium]